jgi:hypothetical protein
MAALSKAESKVLPSIDTTEQALSGRGGTEAFAAPLTASNQVEFVLSLAQSYLDYLDRNAVSDAATAYMSATLLFVKPLLTQYVTMLNLLVRAGVEINGNPFLDEDTVLPEIRAFLGSKEIAAILPEAIFGLANDQMEILEDLTGKSFRTVD